jgi:hypothetical protein
MSRKIRTPKTQVADLPVPAWTFVLLTGTPAPDRIRGWVVQGQAGRFGEPDADEILQRHREALAEEAHAHGFEPAFLTEQRPSGDGFQAWQRQFLADHSY